ncbi:MAG TPA: DUF4340 domain-containing protein [Thermoanaerobaculia bacterium]|nr:DUF4340 domain-containing protein [Thermoanaerobaculia bacterium]
MRPRTLAVLALVVAGLAAFVLLYERELPSSDERRQLEKRVFDVEASAISRLEIERDGARVVLEREPSAPEEDGAPLATPAAWRLIEPLAARADRALADRLASDLAGLEQSRRLEGATRGEVGLEPPRGVVRWRSDAAEGSVEVGGEVPASSTMVVAVSGLDDPVVVGDGLVEALERAPGDWRAKELIAAGRDEIERVRLVPRDGEEVVLSRRGERFVVERPLADAADADRVDPLLGELAGLRAERFLDAPLGEPEAAALAAGPGRIELAVAGRTEPLVIDVGGELESPGTRALRVDGQAVAARVHLEEALARTAEQWRSPAWSQLDSWRVERIRIEDGEGTIELVRDAGDWKSEGRALPYAEAADLLHAITAARAERVRPDPDGRAGALERPELTVVLTAAEGAEETLTASLAGEDGTVTARASGRDVALELSTGTWSDLESRIAALRAAVAASAAPASEAVGGAE